MELTRRGRTLVACGLALVAGALLFDAVELLYVAGILGGLLLAAAWRCVARLGRVPEHVTVDLDADPAAPLVDETSTLTLAVERERTGLPARVVVPLPDAAATTAPLAVELEDHETASFAEPVAWPVAGTYRVGPARYVASDPLGLFAGGVRCDATTTVRVEAADPEAVDEGVDGGRLAAALGRHRTDEPGAGVQPAKLQPYEPGTEIKRIDWKATARLDDVFVVDPETQTHRQTVLLLDHRASMRVGRNPETPIAYLRHAALAIARHARDVGDPIGLYAVGDEGVTVEYAPAARSSHYAALEDAIHDLQVSHVPSDVPATRSSTGHGGAGSATDATSESAPAREDASETAPTDREPLEEPGTAPSTDGGVAAVRDGAHREPRAGLHTYRSALVANRLHRDARYDARTASRLAGRDDEFGERLGPFFADPTEYVHRVADEPLFAAARTYLERVRGSLWTVIVTDDARRAELRETVKAARRANDRVLVVLTPRVCFERTGLVDIDDAYARYREFEEFRRELAALNRVQAIQLAPGDRVETILEAGGEPR